MTHRPGAGIFRAILPFVMAGLFAGLAELSCALDAGVIPLPQELRFVGPIAAATLAAALGQLYALKDQEARFYKDLAQRASKQAESSSQTAVTVARGEAS